MPKASHLLVLY